MTGDRRQETGDRRQETGDRRQETGEKLTFKLINFELNKKKLSGKTDSFLF